MPDVGNQHAVLDLIASRSARGSRPGNRDDRARLALVIEGGGYRGAISGGMATMIEELGLSDAFDDVYGASAGTLNAAWFVAGAAQIGLPEWANPTKRAATPRNLLRLRPLVDNAYLTDVVYEQDPRLPFDRLLRSEIGFHPVATDAATGAAVDLAPFITDKPTLKLAIRASTALPMLAGPPVELAGRRWFDAGLAAAVPFRLAIEAGATHVLILRSRREDEIEVTDGSRSTRLVARYLARHSREVSAAFLDRPARLKREDAELKAIQDDPGSSPAVLSIRPPAGSPTISRLERDPLKVQAGLETGRAVVRQLLGDR